MTDSIRHRWRSLSLSLLCCAAWYVLRPYSATAQVPAEASGHVTDARTGYPIPEARIEVVGQTEHAESETDGSFVLRGVEPGVYTLRIRAIGYVPYTVDVELTNGRATTVNAVLQHEPPHLTDVIVRAASDSNVTGDVPGAITFDRHAIEQSGHRDLGELLQATPGVVVTQYGGPGSASTLSIRGSGANEVLVVVDGVPINSAITGEADLSQVPLTNVQRVTVLPGAQSARYGSRAQAGVVIVETRHADGELSAMTRTGAWGEQEEALSLGDTRSWDGRRAGFAIIGDDRTSQGNFPYTIPDVRGGGTTQRVNDDNTSRSLSTTASVDGDSGSLRLRAGWQDMKRGLPGSIVQPSLTGREDDSRLSEGLDGRLLRGRVALTVAADFTHEHAAFVDTAPPFGGVYNDVVDANGLTLSSTGSAPTPIGTTMIGVEGRSLDVTSDQLAPGAPHWQEQLGTWASVRSSHMFNSGLIFTSDATARLDRDTFVQGTTLSPRAEGTLSYLQSSLSVSIGQGYTPPSLGDQFFHEGVLVRPNPNLQPERVHGDLTVRAAIHDIQAGAIQVSGDADAYRANVDGMILWFPDYRFVWSPTNFDVHRSGWDASSRIAIPAFGADVQGTLSQSNVTYAGTVLSGQVAYRPRTTANITAGVHHSGAHLDLTTRYVGTRRTVAGSDLNLLDPYWLTDARLALPLIHQKATTVWDLDAMLGLENVFNRPAAMLVDYPFPGRTWTVSLRLRHDGAQHAGSADTFTR